MVVAQKRSFSCSRRATPMFDVCSSLKFPETLLLEIYGANDSGKCGHVGLLRAGFDKGSDDDPSARCAETGGVVGRFNRPISENGGDTPAKLNPQGLCCNLGKGSMCDQGDPAHLMILHRPDSPLATARPRSGRTVRDRRRVRRSEPHRQCRPGGRKSRLVLCAVCASPRSP